MPTDEQVKAERDFESASKNIAKQNTGKQGNVAEIAYGEAYQKMVQSGIAPQIRSQYRINKKYR